MDHHVVSNNCIVDDLVDEFVVTLKRGKFGEFEAAIATVKLLKQVISCQFNTLDELICYIRHVGTVLTNAKPIEFVIGNIVRRTLKIIRDAGKEFESNNEIKSPINQDVSLHKLLDQPAIDSLVHIRSSLTRAIIEDLDMLIEEVRDSQFEIAKQSIHHICAHDLIFTYGCSETVCAFLKNAIDSRQFEVIVCETAPTFDGHQQASILSSGHKPIETTLINDSSLFAMMSIMNKVIIECHAIFANGGLLVRACGLAIALAAHHYAIPFIALAGLHKLTPLHHQANFNEYHNPAELISFQASQIKVENLAYDYIRPDLVTLLLTNGGSHNPSYIYRLLADHYHFMDIKRFG